MIDQLRKIAWFGIVCGIFLSLAVGLLRKPMLLILALAAFWLVWNMRARAEKATPSVTTKE